MASKKTATPTAGMEAQTGPGIHLPPPSYWPILLALGVVLIAIGIIFTVIISIIGVIVMLAAIVGWTQENRNIAMQEDHHE